MIKLAVALFQVFFALVVQDGTSEYGVARIVYLQDVPRLSNEELSDALARLRKQTKMLESEIRNPRPLDGNAAMPTTGSDSRSGSSFIGPAPASQNSIQKKAGDIERNILLLQKIFKEKERRAKMGGSEGSMSVPNQGSGSGSRLPGPANGSDTRPMDGSSSKMMNTPELQLPQQVVSNIVDPFELGNSLLLSGNTKEAIKFYDLVPDDKLSPYDLHWLYLLKACCQRANGDLAEAERTYREVANVKNGRRASEAARSWLKYISSRQSVEQIVQQYSDRADMTLQKAQAILEKYDGK